MDTSISLPTPTPREKDYILVKKLLIDRSKINVPKGGIVYDEKLRDNLVNGFLDIPFFVYPFYPFSRKMDPAMQRAYDNGWRDTLSIERGEPMFSITKDTMDTIISTQQHYYKHENGYTQEITKEFYDKGKE